MVDLAERTGVASRPWLASYDPGVPATLNYPEARLDALLRRSAARFPDRPALAFFGRVTSYRALDQAVDRVARGLQGLGLNAGERIALFMPNCPQLVMAYYGVWRAGCVAVPINPRATAVEIARCLDDSDAVAAIVLDRAWRRVHDVALPPHVRHLVVANVADDLASWRRILARATLLASRRRPTGSGDAAIVSMRRLMRDDGGRPVRVSFSGADPAVLLYTGGTTGLPKAAVLTQRNVLANACQIGAWASGLDDGDEVMLSALPLSHGYAMTACMNVAILRGWTQVLIPNPRDLDRVLDGIERSRVTIFPGVPTLYASICSHRSVTGGRRNLRSIEACISGAASLPTGIQAEFERQSGGRLVEGYGLSEASPAALCNPLGRGVPTYGIGLPLPDTDCRLVDVETETRPVAAGQPGILCISGPQVMAGYWKRPTETAEVLHHDLDGRVWLHTGDVAEMRGDGFFRIVDRKKDMIVAAGGLKVYPNEIEDVLSTHPAVRLSAVIGVPPGSPDQRAKAFVVLRAGANANAAEILAFLRERIAAYKLPKSLEFRAELPLAFTGKVLRRVLAEEELSRDPSRKGASADVG